MVLENFAYLPEILIHKIINYTDVLSYRNGKYIDRINKKDNRYNLLQKIPRPIYVGKNKILFRLINYNMAGYLIEYEITKDVIKLNVKFCYRELDGFERYFTIKSSDTYILLN
jgi:hypothetical protein